MRKVIFTKRFLFFVLTIFALLFLFGKKPFVDFKNVAPQVSAQSAPPDTDWYMSGANPERTSWVSEEVSGVLRPVWYRPIDPYIPAKAQLILTNNTVYVPTAKGLYALNAANGNQKWTYATELPIGNSPTVVNAIAYFGGMDHKIYAVRDNNTSASTVWTFEVGVPSAGYTPDADEVAAGFDTNPLVVNGLVILGNRNGYMYAVRQDNGQFAWKFKTGGGIHFSAAHKDGVIYFASDDSYAYALNFTTSSVSQKWKSPKLPVTGFHSYWPVIYKNPQTQQDTVVLVGPASYRVNQMNPIIPIKGSGGDLGELDSVEYIKPIYGTGSQPGIMGPSIGNDLIDFSDAFPYWEQKPWRRTIFVLNAASGNELTWDANNNTQSDYAPFFFFGTRDGSRYPPLVHPSDPNFLYFAQTYSNCGEYCTRGQIAGWQMGTTTLKIPAPSTQANDETLAYSGGGDMVYWTICCDRHAGGFNIMTGQPINDLFGYNLGILDHPNVVAPNYDTKVFGTDAHNDPVDVGPQTFTESNAIETFGNWESGTGWNGQMAGLNGVYGYHGDQNPPIAYQGRVYIHRGNAVLAFAETSSAASSPLALAPIVPKTDTPSAVNTSALVNKLNAEVQKIVSAGHLRPGYSVHGAFNSQSPLGEYADYFHDPADTFLALSRAYPHLTDNNLKTSVRSYLTSELTNYHPCEVSHVGWGQGASRDSFDLFPDIEQFMTSGPSGPGSPRALYAMWKYAKNVPGVNASTMLSNCQALRSTSTSSPEVANASIASQIGYCELEKLANQTTTCSNQATINSMRSARASNFTNTINNDWNGPFGRSDYGDRWKQPTAVARNFLYLTPEFGEYLRNSTQYSSVILPAFNLFSSLAPYWMAEKFEASFNENVIQPSFDYEALFNAKAWILQASQADLARYLDGPGYARGDLFFINNIVTVLEAPGGVTPTSGPSLTPTPVCGAPGDIDCSQEVNSLDLAMLIFLYGQDVPGGTREDIDLSGKVNSLDLTILLSNFGK